MKNSIILPKKMHWLETIVNDISIGSESKTKQGTVEYSTLLCQQSTVLLLPRSTWEKKERKKKIR